MLEDKLNKDYYGNLQILWTNDHLIFFNNIDAYDLINVNDGKYNGLPSFSKELYPHMPEEYRLSLVEKIRTHKHIDIEIKELLKSYKYIIVR